MDRFRTARCLKLTLINFFTIILVTIISVKTTFGQVSPNDCRTSSCMDYNLIKFQERLKNEFENLASSERFRSEFEKKYGIDFTTFTEMNSYYLAMIERVIISKIKAQNLDYYELKSELFSKIDEFRDNFLFETQTNRRTDVTHLGKYIYVPHETDEDMWGSPKTLLCANAGFEDQNLNGWQTLCAQVNNAVAQTVNETPYTPPAGCPAPVNGAAQHSIVTGGVDPNTGFPMVFPNGGGASAMIGDGTGTGGRASVLRKTFLVDPNNTLLTYSYMAVLENPAGHAAGEQAFFRARLFDQNGVSDPCASYQAYGGDGQPGWVLGGAIQYRNWTTILVPLDAYIGQTVTLELAAGDCSQSGHFGYAYVDVSCSMMEIDQICEGESTVLVAPDGGGSYVWNTGATTQQITINTPGLYICTVTPFGSTCSVDIPFNATLYPIPTADFTLSSPQVCIGGEVQFTDNSSVTAGGTINTYQWDFGDGISTPASTGAIAGVPQTTGTYLTPGHTYATAGNPNITLTIETTDGCTSTHTEPLVVTTAPTAIIGTDAVVCQNEASPVVTFTGAGTAGPYTFTYNVNGGANEFITTSIGNPSATLNVPTGNSGTFAYNLLNVSDPSSATCSQPQAGSAVITVNPLPTAQVLGTTSVCQNSATPTITFTGANGTSEYTFTYTINGGANQTLTTVGSASATVNVPTANPGVFSYNLVSVLDVTTGCSQAQIGSAVVTVNPLPTATILGTTTVCLNDTEPQVTFTGALGTSDYIFTYTINGGTNQTVSTLGSNSITVNAPTSTSGTFVYNLLSVQDATTLCSQDQVDDITITVNPLPVASISDPLQVCLNDPQPIVTFEGATGTSPFTFTYTLNGGAPQSVTTLAGNNTLSISVPTSVAGTFIYEITNIQEGSVLACQQTQNVATTITVHSLPVVFAGNDISLCVGETVILTGSGAGAGGTYTWDNGIMNGMGFVPADTTIYTVTGTDINGCQDTDEVIVNVVPFPVMNIQGYNLSGCEPVTSSFDNLSSGILVDCHWVFSNGVTIDDCGSTTVTFEHAGCYDVTLYASTAEGCSSTLTLTDYVCVDANPIANFEANPDELSTYNWESQMENQSSGADSYIWDFGDGSSNSYTTNPSHEFPNVYGGTYQIMLIAITDAGCRDTAYQIIKVKEELLYYVPNTFTPDGDMFNETFKPIFATGFDPQGYTLLIFNRWGDIVFESHDVEVGWNGLYNGSIAQDGTYTWKIEVKRRTSSEIVEATGHVNILR